MVDFKPILFVIGALLATLGLSMLFPALYDLAVGNPDWITFSASALITIFVGVVLAFSNQGPISQLTIKQAFLLTTLSWIALAMFSALPFAWSVLNMSYTDAFFEAMSGLTTTGATVITGLDAAPPGILLWRALLQWLGGIGIIVMALAVMPMLQIGGMQLFRMESSDNSEKILPRAAQLANSIFGLYVVLTLLCIIGYMVAGMTSFDATAHAMTTIATGGFSTHDASMGHFKNVNIEMIAILFMIAGSLPFGLYLYAINGQVKRLLFDSQVRWFFLALILFISLAWLSQFIGNVKGSDDHLRRAAFNVVSIMTGTGYATHDYGHWSLFSEALFFFIMFIGGCAGSTSCGIKIFRFQVLYESIKDRVFHIIQPSGVFIPKYNGRPLDSTISSSVMSFFFLFFLCFSVLSFLLSLYDMDAITALSAAGSALANVGPGLGEVVGPAGTFKPLPDGAKWLLSLGMLLGRLELFTVLVLFLPDFWRR